jgi:Secretion system C-terminal sorting domain
LVTRGEYLVSLDNHLQVMDRSSLELLYAISLDDIPYTTEGISIVDNQAFVAVNNGFDFGNEVGQLAIIDLEAQDLTSIVELGVNGNNPDNLMLDGEYIYTLNNKDYTGSSVSAYRLSDGNLTTTDLINISAGCGTSVLYAGAIYYQELFGTSLSKYNPLSTEVEAETEFGQSFYALEFDELNNLMYVTTTDFFSYGNLLVYDATGNLLHTVATGVSPGNIAMDVRSAVAIETVAAQNAMQVYPNPAADYVTVSLPLLSDYKVFNLSGSQVTVELLNNNTIDVAHLPAGIYNLQVLHDASWMTTTFVRE